MYVLEPEDDVVPKAFTGTGINWKEGRDVTVEEQKRRVKSPKVRGSWEGFEVFKDPQRRLGIRSVSTAPSLAPEQSRHGYLRESGVVRSCFL